MPMFEMSVNSRLVDCPGGHLKHSWKEIMVGLILLDRKLKALITPTAEQPASATLLHPIREAPVAPVATSSNSQIIVETIAQVATILIELANLKKERPDDDQVKLPDSKLFAGVVISMPDARQPRHRPWLLQEEEDEWEDEHYLPDLALAYFDSNWPLTVAR